MRRIVLGLVATLLLVYIAVAVYFSSVIIDFDTRTVEEDQQHRGYSLAQFDLPTPEDVRFEGPDGTLAGWWFEVEEASCAAVLLHGYRGSRWGSLSYAPLFLPRGCSVLAYDHRRHGESHEGYGTFGWHERHDVVAAVDWVTERTGLPRSQVAVMGESYGATTALMAAPLLTDVAFIASDAAYSGLNDILEERGARQYGAPILAVVPVAIAIAGLRADFPLGGFDVASAVREGQPPVFISHSLADDETEPVNAARIGFALDPTRSAVRLTNWGSKHAQCINDDPERYREGFEDFVATYAPGFFPPEEPVAQSSEVQDTSPDSASE